ncbi:MAG: hypothetical protein P8Z36_03405 [Gemmatimonadota bacterium]|jgi:hypothetical protein
MSSRFGMFLVAIAGASACAPSPQIVCTPGAIQACFGIVVDFRSFGSDSTRITIDVQDLQGTVPQDNAAWSQLLYVRVYRNMDPSLGFPGPGAITPTWDAAVQTIGPSAPGSGWHNTGANSPSFVSEWVASGGGYGTDVGYVSGRDTTYNQVVHTGAGLRTYIGPGKNPGWVRFSFVAQHVVTSADVGVQLSAWASPQPASTLQAPQQVGCQVITGGGPVVSGCAVFPYNLN